MNFNIHCDCDDASIHRETRLLATVSVMIVLEQEGGSMANKLGGIESMINHGHVTHGDKSSWMHAYMELTNYTRIGALHNSIALDWAFIILNDPRVGVEIAIRQTMQCIMCHPTSSKASNMNNNIKLTKARKYIVVYNLSHDITRMEKNANNEHVSTLHQYEDQISLK